MVTIHVSASDKQKNHANLESRPRLCCQRCRRCWGPKSRVVLVAVVLTATALTVAGGSFDSASAATAFISTPTVPTVAESFLDTPFVSPFFPSPVVRRGNELSASWSPVAESSSFPVPFAVKAGSTTSSRRDGIDVTIVRTSPNSRRISGEAVALAPLEDVWAILTDYDNLSTHVPNLVESKRVAGGIDGMGGGVAHSTRIKNDFRPGDGSYRCRLYQRGTQKIFGFEFGADVTMDMSEQVIESGRRVAINFDCVDSQFFTEFDGAWTLEALDVKRTIVRYVVDVRPKGSVPVAALEWRITEEVPTNLSAVRLAAVAVGGKLSQQRQHQREGFASTPGASSFMGGEVRMAPSMKLDADWYIDETMATYL